MERFEEAAPGISGICKIVNDEIGSIAEKNSETRRRSMIELVDKFEEAWLLGTDMGLVWRLRKELEAIGDYRKEFLSWRKAELGPLGNDTIEMAYTWPALHSPEERQLSR
jgi:hypothetical protein